MSATSATKKRARTPASVGGAVYAKSRGLVQMTGVLLTPAERESLRVAAGIAGESMGAFVRRVVAAEAERVVSEFRK